MQFNYSFSHTSMTRFFPLCERDPLAVRLFAIQHNVTTSTHLVTPRDQITLKPCPSNDGSLLFVAIKP